MIVRDDGCLRVTVPMTMDHAQALLEAGRALLPTAGKVVIDLSAVTRADASALAVMLAWLRRAPALRSTIVFAQIPASVLALAELHGVKDLLPQV